MIRLLRKDTNIVGYIELILVNIESTRVGCKNAQPCKCILKLTSVNIYQYQLNHFLLYSCNIFLLINTNFVFGLFLISSWCKRKLMQLASNCEMSAIRLHMIVNLIMISDFIASFMSWWQLPNMLATVRLIFQANTRKILWVLVYVMLLAFNNASRYCKPMFFRFYYSLIIFYLLYNKSQISYLILNCFFI